MPYTEILRTAGTGAPVPTAGHCWPVPLQETLTLKGRSGSVSCGGHCSLPWILVQRFCLCPLNVSGGYEVWKCACIPPTVLLQLLLCPWRWGIFFWWVSTFSCWWLVSASCDLVFSQEKMSALSSPPLWSFRNNSQKVQIFFFCFFLFWDLSNSISWVFCEENMNLCYNLSLSLSSSFPHSLSWFIL